MYTKYNIAIAGAGGIGRAVGLLLADNKDLDVKLYIGDIKLEIAQQAANWIEEGIQLAGVVQPYEMPLEGSNAAMDHVFETCDILLDCLPGSQAPRMANFAKKNGMHYINLTEYVKETNDVIEIAKGADTGFVLQAGLAPGFINILANQLYQKFNTQYDVEVVDKIEMKVGALTDHTRAPHFYGFTWSPIGVATEYVKDAIAIRDFKKVTLPALSEPNTIIIDGQTFEDNLTSGGAADLPDVFEGKVKDLDYKTIRYPGHYQWVKETLAGVEESKKIEHIYNEMVKQIPTVEDDIVIVYASVVGKDKDGILRAIEKSYFIKPIHVGTKKLRAIQSTTAAPMAELARMTLIENWSGPVFQSQIDPDAFMNGPFVSMVYDGVVKKMSDA
jgi:saccharopine dehydrogenase-like NADP-dependent oxidoreductase